jgi:membrane associated rhomboid family serine protease
MGSAMGKGRELGLKLREWIEAGTLPLDHATGLANRMIDVLGADDALKAPVRDLASQPLLLRALDQRGGAQRSAIQSLLSDLSSTYTAQVMEELTALLEAATGVSLPERPSSAFPAPSPAAPLVSPEGAAAPALTSPLAPQRGSSSLPALRKLRNLSDFAATLERLGPGLALAAATALVLHWGAGELDTWVLRPWRWNGALVLAGVLLLVQLLALLPWLAWKRQGPLRQAAATDPRRAWNWVTAPWIHHNGLEAGLNVLVLLAILGTSPLSLADGVLRYCLTCLATMALGVFVALHRCRDRVWDGASGAISALIALATTLSLLHWRVMEFNVGPVGIPAWVLLVIYGSLQLGWQLPRRSGRDSSSPWDRLFSSQWWWGLVLGVVWALISWASSLANELLIAITNS